MEKPASLRYAWYVVAVLMLAYISSFIDRQVLTLLVKPLKRDFQITDTQYGLLVGLSFALFYTFLGIPIGRMADRQNRKRIIVWGIIIWSLMTALCGVTHTYNQLFLARIGVGIGEAALSPAAYSLITDMFPRQKLGTALGIYNIGVYLGSGLSILLVAVILQLLKVEGTWSVPFFGEIFPWQTVFFIVGLPGLLIVLLIVLTVKEPERQNVVTKSVPIAEIIAYFNAHRTAILCLFVGIAFMAFGSYSVTSWTPTLLERHYGLTASQAGLTLGAIVTIFSTSGVIVGGRYGDVLTKKGHTDAKMRVGFIGMSVALGLALVMLLIFSLDVAPLSLFLVLLSLACFFSSMPYGSATAAVQEMIPASMRATFSALFLFVVNLIGLTGGPSMVGLLNDRFFHDESKVHLSLAITMVFGCSISVFLLYKGLRAFGKTVAALR
ncbi:MAG: MFS transporter [Spirosomaceae bacterium]|nr:MFS transporter [Spirosomataceae bacterium]